MGKGSSPAGSTTATTVSPTATAQLPYLEDVWAKAKDLYNTKPGITPALTQAYQNYADTGTSIDTNLRPVTNATYNTALTGGYGVQNSPAYPYLTPLAAGTTAPQTNLATYGAQAATPTGVGYDELAASARGDYLNKNPYIDAVNEAAVGPNSQTARTYQTVTDPTTRYNFSSAGRYGSPALEGAGGVRSTNELNLAKTLADTSAGIYSKDYASERALQDTAAKDYVTGANYGLGIGVDAAGRSLTGLQAGANALQSGYQAGNTAALTGLGYTPQVTDANLAGSKANIAAGTGLLSSEYAPLNAYSSLAGQPVTGSSSTTNPYFQNSTANTLSGLTGAAGLANTLSTGSTGSGLLSSGGLLGSQGALFGTAADASIAAGGPPLAAGITAADAAALTPAAAATIICTELMKQGRMPRRWWRASTRDWMPEIVYHGYLVWARPSVRHLRRHPYSLYSRLLCAAFNWRGEDAAARHGLDKQARRLWRGRAVTAALAIPCLVLGVAATIGARQLIENLEHKR